MNTKKSGKPSGLWCDRYGVKLYLGDARENLKLLAPGSVQCCVTSPPYWGLRDYGTGEWEGGNSKCGHKLPPIEYIGRKSTLMNDGRPKPGFVEGQKYTSGTEQFKDICKKCGAKRTDCQLGSEPSPDCGTQGQAQCGQCFVCNMVVVFREVHRVLRDDGCLFLNLGDSYSGGSRSTYDTSTKNKGNGKPPSARPTGHLPSGNLIGVPWRVALALQADGWVLRQDLIWSKTSPMPESVQNRCTKSHEYVFLLTKKGSGYFCDMEAIKEPVKTSLNTVEWQDRKMNGATTANKVTGHNGKHGENMSHDLGGQAGRANKRSVWTVSSHPYPGAHFATFPPKLIEPMILAGTSAKGQCPGCGQAWVRVTKEKVIRTRKPEVGVRAAHKDTLGQNGKNSLREVHREMEVETLGWKPDCQCGINQTVPQVVLDPFAGTCTVGEVCLRHNRHFIGIDLSEKYLKQALNRVFVEGDLAKEMRRQMRRK